MNKNIKIQMQHSRFEKKGKAFLRMLVLCGGLLGTLGSQALAGELGLGAVISDSTVGGKAAGAQVRYFSDEKMGTSDSHGSVALGALSNGRIIGSLEMGVYGRSSHMSGAMEMGLNITPNSIGPVGLKPGVNFANEGGHTAILLVLPFFHSAVLDMKTYYESAPLGGKVMTEQNVTESMSIAAAIEAGFLAHTQDSPSNQKGGGSYLSASASAKKRFEKMFIDLRAVYNQHSYDVKEDANIGDNSEFIGTVVVGRAF